MRTDGRPMQFRGKLKGLSGWLARRHFDEWLFEWRSAFALILGLAAIGLVLVLIFTLLGWAWRPDPFAQISLSDEVEALLALGTLALAYAALVQAVAGIRFIRISVKPSLVLACYKPEATSPNLQTPTDEGPIVAVRNLGPGPAKNLRVVWATFTREAEAEICFTSGGLLESSKDANRSILPYLGVERDACWILPLQAAFSAPHCVVELHADSVLDLPDFVRVYSLHGKPVTRDNVEVWNWRMTRPPQVKPDFLLEDRNPPRKP